MNLWHSSPCNCRRGHFSLSTSSVQRWKGHDEKMGWIAILLKCQKIFVRFIIILQNFRVSRINMFFQQIHLKWLFNIRAHTFSFTGYWVQKGWFLRTNNEYYTCSLYLTTHQPTDIGKYIPISYNSVWNNIREFNPSITII